ncbi:MAG: sortase [Oscillospiraceae bacterium]|nr:sortase [Oscillospiraceae bacterium]
MRIIIRKRLVIYIIILIALLMAVFTLFSYDKSVAAVQDAKLAAGVQSFFDQIDVGVQDTGAQDTGIQDTGAQGTGVQDTGVQDADAQNTGAQDADAQNIGTQNTGTQNIGTQNIGVQNIGVQNTTAQKNTSTSKTAKIDGQTILGVIKISKINIQYPIIQYVNENSLDIAICKYSSDKNLNDFGNVVIIGHNMLSGLMFHKLDKLGNGDSIQITDATGQTITYKVNDTYIINPTETDCLKTTDSTKREITLITCCTNNFNKRLVIKAVQV